MDLSSRKNAFWDRVVADPADDDTVRLVYADWLEEHAQTAAETGHARLIRAQFARDTEEAFRLLGDPQVAFEASRQVPWMSGSPTNSTSPDPPRPRRVVGMELVGYVAPCVGYYHDRLIDEGRWDLAFERGFPYRAWARKRHFVRSAGVAFGVAFSVLPLVAAGLHDATPFGRILDVAQYWFRGDGAATHWLPGEVFDLLTRGHLHVPPNGGAYASRLYDHEAGLEAHLDLEEALLAYARREARKLTPGPVSIP